MKRREIEGEVRVDGGLYQGGSEGDEKWSDSGYIMKVEVTG